MTTPSSDAVGMQPVVTPGRRMWMRCARGGRRIRALWVLVPLSMLLFRLMLAKQTRRANANVTFNFQPRLTVTASLFQPATVAVGVRRRFPPFRRRFSR